MWYDISAIKLNDQNQIQGGFLYDTYTLTSETFDQAVNAGDDLVVVDFFATWCGPCKMLSPTVEKMAELHPEVHFYKVDIDEDMDLATRFKVMSVPTLLYFRRGVVANKTIGVISASEMEQAIAKAK